MIAAGTYEGTATGSNDEGDVPDVQFVDGGKKSDHVIIRLRIDTEDGMQTVQWFGYLSEKALPFTIEKLRSMGARMAKGDITDMHGLGTKTVSVTIRYEEWQGEQKMKVDIGGGGSFVSKDRLDKNGRAAFAARFRGSVAHVAGSNDASKDDDIPI